MSIDRNEISFEVTADEAAVLDGYCQAKGIKRPVVMRRLLRDWSEEKLHESIFVCRVTGVNPTDPEPVRPQSGTLA